MINVTEVLKAPFKDKQWPAKIAIGGVVSVVPILFFCSGGYLVSLLRSIIRKEEKFMPEWVNWGKLFTDGILYCVIFLAYMVIPFLISMLATVFGGGCLVGWVFGAFLLFVAAIAGLAAGFVLPMVICQYVDTGDLRSAFMFKPILEKIKSVIKDYGTAYLVALGLFVAAYVVCFLLGLIIIGWIVFPFLFFYLHIVIITVFGQLYAKSFVEKVTT